jgi:hypothetical protein
MPDGTTYSPTPHQTTDPLKLKAGQKLNQDLFPLVSN